MRTRIAITNVRRLVFSQSSRAAFVQELFPSPLVIETYQSNHFPRITVPAVVRCMSTFDDPNKHSSDESRLHEEDTFQEDTYERFDDDLDPLERDDDSRDDDDDDNNNNSHNSRAIRKKRRQDSSNSNRRMYLNTNLPLEQRVQMFLNQRLGEIHPLDVVITSQDLIRQCGKRNTLEGMKYAHDILDRLLEEKRHFNQSRTGDGVPQPYTIVIPERTFEILMYGWSNLSRQVPVAVQRMREVLDLMIKEADYDETIRIERRKAGAPIPENVQVLGKKHSDVDPKEMFANMSCQPTVGIYNTLLNGLAQASYQSIARANEAEDALRLMERIAVRRGWHIRPNTKSFTTVINAFARTKHHTAGERAESVLRRMIRSHEQQLQLYREETGEDYDVLHREKNSRMIVTPDTIAYTAVIQAHVESGVPGSSEKALILLNEVLQSSDPRLTPDAYIFSATINAFAKQAATMNIPSGRLEAAEAAESIMWLMVDSIQGMSNQVADNYEVPCNACMKSWANANLKESPTRAELILHKMLDPEFFSKTGIKASTRSFNTCIHAWSRAARLNSEAPQKAENLLQLMGQFDSVDADVTSYSTVITAYAMSKRADKVLQARRVLELLLTNLDTMPSRDSISAIPFTAVLNAIVHSTNNKLGAGINPEADPFGIDEGSIEQDVNEYSMALKIQDEVCSDSYGLGITPDHLFFASLIDVIAKCTSPDSIERRQRLEQIFEDAASCGEVSSKVVESLAKACPSQDMLRSMLGLRKWPVDSVNVFPRQWTRKVPPTFKQLRSESRNRRGNSSQNNHRKKSPNMEP